MTHATAYIPFAFSYTHILYPPYTNTHTHPHLDTRYHPDTMHSNQDRPDYLLHFLFLLLYSALFYSALFYFVLCVLLLVHWSCWWSFILLWGSAMR